jgi:hypothetical protein
MDLLSRLVALTREAYAIYDCRTLDGPIISRQLSNPEYINMMDDALDVLRKRYGIEILSSRALELREFSLRLAAIQVSVNQVREVVALLLHDLSAN